MDGNGTEMNKSVWTERNRIIYLHVRYNRENDGWIYIYVYIYDGTYDTKKGTLLPRAAEDTTNTVCS